VSEIKLRSMFIAPPGHLLLSFDLAQAESWIVAYLANEPRMKEALVGGYFHAQTASLFFNKPRAEITQTERYTGKKGNHATAYRQGPFMMATSINKESDKPPYVTVTLKQTKEFYKKWHEFYKIKGWWNEIEFQLNQTRSLTTPYGRKRVFYAQWGEELFKEATAFVPQSTVADHMNGMVQDELGLEGGIKGVYRKVIKFWGGQIKIVNQAHDSIIIECPSTIKDEIIPLVFQQLKRPIIINGESFTIPVDCEIGERWGELEKIKL